MNYLLLLFITVSVAFQHIVKKAYNVKHQDGVWTFSAASIVPALIFFVFTSGGAFDFNFETFKYSAAFAINYIITIMCSMLAIKTGPLSLSSLISAYSLIIPTFYGLIALGESVNLWLICGIILLVASVFFINMESKGTQKKITLKWIIFIFLTFLCNGLCNVVQKIQQINSGGLYKSEFMIMALAIAIVALFVAAIATEKKAVPRNLKKGFGYYTVCGVVNGAANYLILVLANKMPASVMYPVISAGGVVLAALVAVFIYKEKLSSVQWLGMFLGTLAIVVLNI